MKDELFKICCELIEQKRSPEWFYLAINLSRKEKYTKADKMLAEGIILKYGETNDLD